MLSSSLDPQMAANMRHLSKRDPTTKVKALQALRAAVRQRANPSSSSGGPGGAAAASASEQAGAAAGQVPSPSPEAVAELALMLAPWAYQYARLACDNSRAVRQEAAALTGELVAAVRWVLLRWAGVRGLGDGGIGRAVTTGELVAAVHWVLVTWAGVQGECRAEGDGGVRSVIIGELVAAVSKA